MCAKKAARRSLLAKGKDLIALKIRFIAEENGIPIYEDKALARSLYDKRGGRTHDSGGVLQGRCRHHPVPRRARQAGAAGDVKDYEHAEARAETILASARRRWPKACGRSRPSSA